jgi:hypothetical protein
MPILIPITPAYASDPSQPDPIMSNVTIIIIVAVIIFIIFTVKKGTKIATFEDRTYHPINGSFENRLYHPINGSIEEIREGFSWWCLIFGFLWYLYKGVWGWGIIALILALPTAGISWLVFPFFANEHHAKDLLKRGYLTEKQWMEKTTNDSKSNLDHKATSYISDELSKLSNLNEQGIISNQEFLKLKEKLLS